MIQLRQRFGRLTVTSAATLSKMDKRKRHACRCDCGKTIYVLPADLDSGATTSCGCEASASAGQDRRVESAR